MPYAALAYNAPRGKNGPVNLWWDCAGTSDRVSCPRDSGYCQCCRCDDPALGQTQFFVRRPVCLTCVQRLVTTLVTQFFVRRPVCLTCVQRLVIVCLTSVQRLVTILVTQFCVRRPVCLTCVQRLVTTLITQFFARRPVCLVSTPALVNVIVLTSSHVVLLITSTSSILAFV